MAGTDLQTRSTMDLTRSPAEQWNKEMMQLVCSQVLKKAATYGEQVYCLSVCDALGLNPFIDEIYFLPSKSTDGSGPGIKPYIGRNGLVKKATDVACYFEAETVRENDKFRVTRKAGGERTVSHSYGHESERGEIVGAYAFLHDASGEREPAFFYAPLEEYLPEFDTKNAANGDWKMGKSPWGNQRSAMIEKCAMIGAGRKRLNLGGVLMDGEIPRVLQQEAGRGGLPSDTSPAGETEFDWSTIDAPARLVDRLRAAVFATNDLRPNSWTPAKLQIILRGMSVLQLMDLAGQIAAELRPTDEEEVADAVLVPELTEEQRERATMLQNRIADLKLQHQAAETDKEHDLLDAEIEVVGAQLAALAEPQAA